MRWEGVVIVLLYSSVLMGAGEPAVAPSAAVEATQERPLVMKGTVEERNALINRTLGNPLDVMKQINLGDMDVDTALYFFGLQNRIDVRIRWDELEKKGVRRDSKVTLNFYNTTYLEVLEEILWQIRPAEGRVGWKVENGILAIVPMADAGPAKETDAQIKRDAEIRAMLKDSVPDSVMGKEMEVKELLRQLFFLNKVNLIVDAMELQKSGVAENVKIVVNQKGATVNDALNAVVGALRLTKGEAGYDVWGGVVRVSTLARLNKERPLVPGLP